jgi:hypothetical protein
LWQEPQHFFPKLCLFPQAVNLKANHVRTCTIWSFRTQDQSTYCNALWLHYCRVVEKQPFDRAAASAAWHEWLGIFIPDKSSRSTVPLPKCLVAESAL